MKKIVFITVLLLPVALLQAQTDSAVAKPVKIYKSKVLNKGFYKSKEEFFNNAPSIIRDFSVKEQTTSEKKIARGMMAVSYKLEEGEPLINEKVWGFCDGNDVYVYFADIRGDFRKLDCIGPYPFFLSLPKTTVPGLILTGAVEGTLSVAAQIISLDNYCEIFLMNEKGKFKKAYSADVLELFEWEPDIWEHFRYELGPDIEEPNPNRNTITRKYLTEFNKRLIEEEK